MKEYEQIIRKCEENSRISKRVVDEYLIYYAAARNNLESRMIREFDAYRHITKQLKIEWLNMMKSQFIAHEIFKEEGLIGPYLNHAELKRINKEERKYLEFQFAHPWRFSFSIVKENPEKDLYLMEDVFDSEEFLLFSPGITTTLQEQAVILWFNLIGYNGSCYQSYGPIGAYKSFEPDDIFFFATELNPDISDEDDLLSDIKNNPIPYMMLISGANYPLVANKNDQIVHVLAEYDMENMDTGSMKDSFITEYNRGVYRLSLNKWNEHPHFSQAYFDETNKSVLISSMTDRGFKALVNGLNKYGYDFSDEPLVRVNLTMLRTASEILRRNIDLLKYEKLFSKLSTPEEKEKLDKLNLLLEYLILDINAGREPDIASLASKAGVDIEVAKKLVSQIMKKYRK
jgi:hypothetical protein